MEEVRLGKKLRSGVTEGQRKTIRKKLLRYTKTLSKAHSLYSEAVVLEMRYFHQSATNPFRTNATKRDKEKSLLRHKGRCQAKGCKMNLGIVVKKGMEFHHLKRGVPKQHDPGNLKPFCKGCHQKEHQHKRK